MKIHIGIACLVFVLQAQFGASQDQPPPLTAQDLSGKWEGKPPLGGTLEINMTVSPSGKIEGKGLVRGGGTKATRSYVSGEVKGQKVFIQTDFPVTQDKVRYRCVWKERDTLECTTPIGFETTFKKQGNP